MSEPFIVYNVFVVCCVDYIYCPFCVDYYYIQLTKVIPKFLVFLDNF
jgi:hypothetical protein